MSVTQTSLLAYKQLEKIGAKQRICYDVIQREGSTSNYDIAHLLGWDINRVTGRVKELRERGLVKQAYKSIHPITDRLVIYWEVTDVEPPKEQS